MVRNNELIRVAKKAADAWRNTDAYHQAAQIIDMLVEELERDTLTQPNEPLTLEELRKMDRHPVWVKLLKPNQYINPPTGWRILEKSLAGTFGVWDGENSLIERHYGTDWLAYRRPPEGEKETE